MKQSLKHAWSRRPRIGAPASIALHLSVMLLCAIAIGQGFLPTIAWILFVANAIGAAAIALSEGIGELPEHRKPFGPFTEAADFLGFLDENTRQGRAVRWLRERGFLE